MIITPDGFIEVPITADMIARAQFKADEMGELRNSIRRGQGNLAGFLGEEVVLSAWGGSSSHNTYQHDIEFEGTTFEVKTKDRTVRPRIDYEASVANYNARQKADFYVFTSLLRVGLEYKTGFIIGIYSKADYITYSTFLKKGDVDPSNGWVVSADCYNLRYSDLHRFESWAQTAAAA